MTALAQRAHPFTTGAVAIGFIALAIIVPTTTGALVLYTAVVLLAIGSGAGRGVRLALVVVAPIWILLFILQVLLGADPKVSGPLGIAISQPGTTWALSQGIRLAALATASLAFASSFDPHRFLQAAIARRWPFGAAFLLVATLDAAEQLRAQAQRLREAQRTRGVHVRGSLAARMRAVPALVFPLLLVSLTEADDRALALETRGLLIRGPRTAVDPPRDTGLDRAVRWSMLAVVILAVAWRARS